MFILPPGYWLFHCHIEFHAEIGMALIFKVGEHKDFPPVPKNFPRCESYMPLKLPIVRNNSEMIFTKSTTDQEMPPITVDDSKENEVDSVKKVQNSIKNWLPLVLKELGLKSAASSTICQYFVLGMSLFFVSINHLRMHV